MTLSPSHAARLAFLARVTEKASIHLLGTDTRLFGHLFTEQDAQKIETDPVLAERLDAFVPGLVTAARRCASEAQHLLTLRSTVSTPRAPGPPKTAS